MPVNENIEVSDDKQNSFLVKFKRSLRIGKKCKEKDPGTSSLAGQSQTNQQSSLKYVSLIPAHRMKKKAEDTDQGGEKVSEEGEGSGLVNVVDEEELPTFSGGQESKERSLPDVGQSQTNQQSSLKYVSLIPAHRMKKKAEDTDQGGEKVSEEGEGSGLVNVVDEEELPTFSGGQESERSLPDVGNIDVTNKKSESGTGQETEGAEEQRRLYRAVHEVRKELIMKEKRFHEENLKFYKRQLEAEDIFGHGLQE